MKTEKYLSKYSNGKEISAAQYITEIICERKASFDKIDLHYKFWLQKKWQTFYKNQIGSAHKLLKKYSAKSIIRALSNEQGKKIYSLRAPHLIPIIEKEVELIDKENTTLTKLFDRKSETVFLKHASKKNILSKLKDIDNES